MSLAQLELKLQPTDRSSSIPSPRFAFPKTPLKAHCHTGCMELSGHRSNV